MFHGQIIQFFVKRVLVGSLFEIEIKKKSRQNIAKKFASVLCCRAPDTSYFLKMNLTLLVEKSGYTELITDKLKKKLLEILK